MRIALNAQLLSRAHSYRGGGISRVIYNVLDQLANDTRGHEVDAFVPELPPAEDGLTRGQVRFQRSGAWTARPGGRIVWEQACFPVRLSALRPDLLHSMAYASPLAWRGPTVLTVYDLSFMRFPEAFNTANRLYLTALTRLSARRARRVITISEHSRRDIVNLLGIPAQRVDVTYPAADSRFRPLARTRVEAFRTTEGLPADFLFCVGTLEPRKNLVGMLEAYAALPRGRPPLYVAGAAGWRYTPIFQAVQQMGLERDVHFLGYLPEDALPLWYNAARVFVFPSLYEGFGLPALEALACGTPVIASSTSSLPEVVGNAAILVDPNDRASLTGEMQCLLDDPQKLGQLREAGPRQAARFTWANLADATVQSYARAVASA